MKWNHWCAIGGMISIGVLIGPGKMGAQTASQLTRTEEGELQMEIHAEFPKITGAESTLKLTLSESDDLLSWAEVGESRWVSEGDGIDILALPLPDADRTRFFRVGREAKVRFRLPSDLAKPSYRRQFAHFLEQTGDLSIREFRQTYDPDLPYLEEIDWDVTTGHFWEAFNTSPQEHNDRLAPDDPEIRVTDFRLNARELQTIRKLGFVVSERLSTPTFVDQFYQIWRDDLPVFFSTDAALHAWHSTYLAMLKDLEVFIVQPEIAKVLRGMRESFPSVWDAHGDGPLGEGLRDTDFFLTIAESLIDITSEELRFPLASVPRVFPTHLSDQSAKASRLLGQIRSHEGLEWVALFGDERLVDFSQFTPRGHYTASLFRQRFFEALMWLGRIDFRTGGGHPDPGSLRQLAGAVSLSLLMEEAGQLENWKRADGIIEMLVGLEDSMSPPALLALLESLDLKGFDRFHDQDDLRRLQDEIVSGYYGEQEILSAVIQTGCDAPTIVPPRSFAFFGQRFTPDGWTMAQVTYDRILRNGRQVPRRLSTALDVAFAVFDNHQVTTMLADRMAMVEGGVPFRDGFPYQYNLVAAYRTLQAQQEAFWRTNLYQRWLGVLRTLSEPTIETHFPQAMRSRAWAMRTLNTQLGSWTALRHNTVLYVKQPVSPPGLCSYPDFFIEPRVPFWEAMEAMARATLEAVKPLPRNDEPIWLGLLSRDKKLGELEDTLEHFAQTMNRLAELSRHHLSGAPFSDEESQFAKDLIELSYVGCGDPRKYSGWYPNLFYQDLLSPGYLEHPSMKPDAIVTDVFTDLPSDCHGDPGAILHEGIGRIHLMMLGVESAGDGAGCLYAGPVYSHYEFTKPFSVRLTDEAWREQLSTRRDLPPHPEWTRDFLVAP